MFRRCLHLAACLLPLSALLFAAAPARAEMEDFPVVRLQSLDKITARTMTFEARVGSTLKYGPLYIKIQACRKSPPIEQPESAAFLQIWEVTPAGEAKWVFSGWMYASSPSLSAMDHPVYDVWVLDCLQKQGGGEAAKSAAAGEKEARDAGVSEPAGAPPENGAPAPKTKDGDDDDTSRMQIRETKPGRPTQEELDAEHAAETEGQGD
jgi:hypothetical protein